jgi:hypothetical protein
MIGEVGLYMRGSILSLLFREGRGRGACRQAFCENRAELDLGETCWQLGDIHRGKSGFGVEARKGRGHGIWVEW